MQAPRAAPFEGAGRQAGCLNLGWGGTRTGRVGSSMVQGGACSLRAIELVHVGGGGGGAATQPLQLLGGCLVGGLNNDTAIMAALPCRASCRC